MRKSMHLVALQSILTDTLPIFKSTLNLSLC